MTEKRRLQPVKERSAYEAAQAANLTPAMTETLMEAIEADGFESAFDWSTVPRSVGAGLVRRGLATKLGQTPGRFGPWFELTEEGRRVGRALVEEQVSTGKESRAKRVTPVRFATGLRAKGERR